MAIVKELLVITYEMSIDTDTGEILETKILGKEAGQKPVSKPSRKKKNEDTKPTLHLDDNKCILSDSALLLMSANPDDKLDIKYEVIGQHKYPVIGKDEVFGTKGGCRLTKTGTISCRGTKHEALAEYGIDFDVKPHPSKENLFILDSGKLVEALIGNEQINTEDKDDSPFDFSLKGLVDDEDAKVTEVDSDFFNL